jgi:hypothetical protein
MEGRRRATQPPQWMAVPSVVAGEGVGKSAPEAKARERAFEPQVGVLSGREKLLSDELRVSVPQTDTGRRVEDTQANGRTLVKELGKMAP